MSVCWDISHSITKKEKLIKESILLFINSNSN